MGATPLPIARFTGNRLLPGATNWTEEQSPKNFQSVSQLVVPGDPKSSLLLLHPVAPEADGEAFHSRGSSILFDESEHAEMHPPHAEIHPFLPQMKVCLQKLPPIP
jgi:hypothetical protein